jgi:imidazolonepropionase-like amidohydrolase
MPATARRGFAPGPTDSVGRQAERVYGRLVYRLWEAGVAVVPGTDNLPGISLLGELEAYARAGIPAPAVLQLATLGAARTMRQDTDYGSLAVGKVADLAVVDGRPAERTADLRRMELVMRGGRWYRAKALLQAAGLTPP